MKPLLFCASIFVFSGSAFGESGAIPATVTGDNVNLRTGPSRRAEIIGQLPRETEVRVVLTDGEWSAITPPEGTAGWISRGYLREGFVNGSRVNVRSGPSVSYSILLTLEDKAEVSVLEEQEQWAKIKLPDTVRLWLNSRYLSTGPVSISAPSAPENVWGTYSPPGREPIRETPPPPPASASRSDEAKTVSRPAVPVSPTGELRSYTGIIRVLEQPLTQAGREYGYELAATRHNETPIAFLTGDTVDLSGYRFRPVRVWAETIEVSTGHPARLEVKGVGFLW